MELRNTAPVVGELVAKLMIFVMREVTKHQPGSAEKAEARAQRLVEYFSICLVCNRIKRHKHFVSRDGVLLSRCMECTPRPREVPRRPWKPTVNQKAYRENNRELLRVQGRNRRAEKRGVPGSYTVEEWISLCERFDYRCVCCGGKDPLEADHVIALARVDSTNDIGNIQPLCKSCNSKKGRDSIDFRQTPFTRSGIEIQSTLRTLRKSVPVATLDGW